MRRIFLLCAALALTIGTSHAQTQITREETLELVSRRLVEIQETMPEVPHMQEDKVPEWVRRRIQDAVAIALKLRDELSDNAYMRVGGFSIGSSGVTVRFDFPPPAPKQKAAQ